MLQRSFIVQKCFFYVQVMFQCQKIWQISHMGYILSCWGLGRGGGIMQQQQQQQCSDLRIEFTPPLIVKRNIPVCRSPLHPHLLQYMKGIKGRYPFYIDLVSSQPFCLILRLISVGSPIPFDRLCRSHHCLFRSFSGIARDYLLPPCSGISQWIFSHLFRQDVLVVRAVFFILHISEDLLACIVLFIEFFFYHKCDSK